MLQNSIDKILCLNRAVGLVRMIEITAIISTLASEQSGDLKFPCRFLQALA